MALFCGLLPAQSGSGYRIDTEAGGYLLGDNGPATAALLWSPEKAITGPSGVIYISESEGHRIRRVSPSGVMTTFAGTGTPGFAGDNDAATAAQLNGPTGMALDAQGNLYVADTRNGRIRRITPAGIITTVAGGAAGQQLSAPRGLAFDAAGTLYITDSASGQLLQLTTAGKLELIAVGLSSPGGIAVDSSGNLFIADSGHHVVQRLSVDGTSGVVAGSGVAGYAGDRGLATAPEARLSFPTDVAVDRLGTLYIADTWNHRIRKVIRQGNDYLLFTEAGGGPNTAQAAEYAGDPMLGPLGGPRGVWLDSAGVLFIADTGYGVVRRLVPGVYVPDAGMGGVGRLEPGRISTVAGASRSRGDGGPATSASLYFPRNVALDAFGNLLIADTDNHKVRRVASGGTIATLAGTGLGGLAGDGGAAALAELALPSGLAVDAAGNVYIGDTGSARLRQVRPAGDIFTLVGANGPGGAGDGAGASNAQVTTINGIALDSAGNIYLADTNNHRIRKISRDNVIERFAGTSSAGTGADGSAILSAINAPLGVAAGRDGTVYFTDTGNHRVRRVLANGRVETIAGTGFPGYSGDGGAATAARLSSPGGIAVDAEGNVFVADSGNHRIRHITSGGLIRTIAGSGLAGFSGDGGSALTAQLSSPMGLAVDSRGTIHVADRANHRIRRLSVDTSAGRLEIVSGNNQSGSTGARLPVPLTVRLVSATGAPVAGTSIAFTVTRGVGQLSAISAVTDAAGVAAVSVTLGGVPGVVVVAASAPGLLPVQFQLTTQGAIVTGQPAITSAGIVGAGLSVPPVRHLAPNGLYTIFGKNFAQPGAGWQVGPADLVNGQLPIRFQGVCVLVDNINAPVIQVYPNQVSFQAPQLIATGVKPVQVVLNCRDKSEVRSNVENVEYRPSSPEFLFFVQNADGRNPVAAVNAVSGVFAGPPGLLPGGNFAPLKPGDYVTLFGSGFGATNPLFFAGELADRVAPVTAGVSVTLGGRPVAASDILYAGATPGFAGLYQLNLRIPDDAPDGNLPITLSVGGVPSPEGAYLTVRR
ncbi:MAG: hypothetical protein HY822_07855 [Acidobacteria bacterium]|nr:hypothetical protein [Acidobacteriota bacterium]